MSSPMYREFAGEYDAAIQCNLFNAKFERPFLLSLLPEVNGKQVLDLGCGPGVYAEELTARGAFVTAVDASDTMIELTKAKLKDKQRCYVQDIAAGLPNETTDYFDLVICPLAIHYIKDVSLLLADIRRVLKPDGLFIFSTLHPYIAFKSSPSGNYFATEEITEDWDTLGRPVPVTYFRRPQSDLVNEISKANMVISNIFEGKVTEELKQASAELYEKLSMEPHFMFYVCKAG